MSDTGNVSVPDMQNVINTQNARIQVLEAQVVALRNQMDRVMKDLEQLGSRCNTQESDLKSYEKKSKQQHESLKESVTAIEKTNLKKMSSDLEMLQTSVRGLVIDNTIRKRKEQERIKRRNEKKGKPGLSLRFSCERPFGGIVDYLREEYAILRGERNLLVSASGIYNDSPRYTPRNVTAGGTSSAFRSRDLPDEWIMYTFVHQNAIVSAYSMAVRFDGREIPSSWVAEVSMDMNMWTAIDTRVKSNIFQGPGGVVAIKAVRKVPCKYFRIRSTGLNLDGTHVLALTSLEVFGKLMPSPIQPNDDEFGNVPYVKDFQGIIFSLWKKYQVNIKLADVADAITNAKIVEGYSVLAIAELWNPNVCCTLPRRDAYVGYDFRGMRVVASHYTLKANAFDGPGSDNLRSWVVEVSQDGSNWKVVDRHEDNYDLDQADAVKTYRLAQPEPLRMIRVRQTGINHCGTYGLALGAFEVYGEFDEFPNIRGAGPSKGKETHIAPNDDALGIMAHLAKADETLKGVVVVSSSGRHDSTSGHQPIEATNTKGDTFFWSGDGPSQWLCYQFLTAEVTVESYTLQSIDNEWIGAANLRSWVVEVSDDGGSWTEVDQRSDVADLDGRGRSKTFDCQRPRSGRFVRLRQTDKSSRGDNQFMVRLFELFGIIKE